MFKWNEEQNMIQESMAEGAVHHHPINSIRFNEIVASGEEILPWATQDELDDMAALEARVAELEAERESANIRDITPQQAKDWIDAQFAAATTNAEVVAAIKRILKKMVVFLLR